MSKERPLGFLNIRVPCLSSPPQSLGPSSMEGTAIHFLASLGCTDGEVHLAFQGAGLSCPYKERGFYHLNIFLPHRSFPAKLAVLCLKLT